MHANQRKKQNPFVQALKDTRSGSGLTTIQYQKVEVKAEDQLSSAFIHIKNNRAVIPSIVEVEGRVFPSIFNDPILISPLTQSALSEAVKKVIFTSEEKITEGQARQLMQLGKKGKHPLLRATNSTSWRNLNKTAVFYSIQTNKDTTKWLLFLNSDTKGKYREKQFPIETPLEELVKIILEDVKRYPHVLREDSNNDHT